MTSKLVTEAVGPPAPVRGRRGRSYQRIEITDLQHLGRIAAEDRERFYRKRPEYRDRLICVALCQGAGKHFVDMANGFSEPNGVKDLDVWSFFAAIPGERFPADRRNVGVDFGPSKFGRQEPDQVAPQFRHFVGRNVDLLMRALPVPVGADPASALRDYLSEGRTKSAQELAAKGAVLIEPAVGTVVWPTTERASRPG
ncbi:MAG: hypothetical protein QOG43_2174 [Actinomycetota bacterium]|jgi:hypothetical protein|nr:hypothetical protein [Actinomycetota bacterium]